MSSVSRLNQVYVSLISYSERSEFGGRENHVYKYLIRKERDVIMQYQIFFVSKMEAHPTPSSTTAAIR